MSKKSQKLYASLIATSLVTAGIVAPVAAESAPAVKAEVTNNVDKKDEVLVKDVPAKAIVKIYTAASSADSASPLVTKTQGSKPGNVKFVLAEQLKVDKIYITVTESGKDEPGIRTEVAVVPEIQTELKGSTGNVEFDLVNNVTKKDSLKITVKPGSKTATTTPEAAAVKVGAVIKVYKDAEKKEVLATSKIAAVKKGKDVSETTINFKNQLERLASADSAVFVTVTNPNQVESEVQTVSIGAEPQTATPTAAQITVQNNVTKKDVVVVSDLEAANKSTVYVYTQDPTNLSADAKKAALIGSAKAKKDKAPKGSTTTAATATITLKDKSKTNKGFAGYDFQDNKVWVVVKDDNKLESVITSKEIVEEKTTDLSDITVQVINNVTTKDKLIVYGLVEKAVVNIYSKHPLDPDFQKKNLIGKGTAKKVKGSDTVADLNITISKGLPEEYVFIEITNPNEHSNVGIWEVKPEAVTSFDTGTVTITNNTKAKDSVKITDLKAKDIVKVYSALKDGKLDEKSVLGNVTLKKDGEATINLKKQLSKTSGDTVYITVQRGDAKPALLTLNGPLQSGVATSISGTTSTFTEGAIVIPAEVLTVAQELAFTPVKIDKSSYSFNISTTPTTETDRKLVAGDVIKIYTSNAPEATPLKTITVTKAHVTKNNVASSFKIDLANNEEKEFFYTVTYKDQLESAKQTGTVQFAVTSYDTAGITLDTTSEAGVNKITVKNLEAKDIVKIYNEAGTKVLKSFTVKDGTSVEYAVTGLKTDDKKFQISVTKPNQAESDKLAVTVKKFEKPGENPVTTDNTASINFTSTFAKVDFGSKLIKGSVATSTALPLAINRFTVVPVATTVFA